MTYWRSWKSETLPEPVIACSVLVHAALAIAGGVVGGAILGGTAVNNGAFEPPAPAVVAPAPAVTVGSATCYFTRAPVNGQWRRVRVCTNY